MWSYVSNVVVALARRQAVLNDLHVRSAGDEQRRQVVPTVVEAERFGSPGTLGRAERIARSTVTASSTSTGTCKLIPARAHPGGGVLGEPANDLDLDLDEAHRALVPLVGSRFSKCG